MRTHMQHTVTHTANMRVRYAIRTGNVLKAIQNLCSKITDPFYGDEIDYCTVLWLNLCLFVWHFISIDCAQTYEIPGAWSWCLLFKLRHKRNTTYSVCMHTNQNLFVYLLGFSMWNRNPCKAQRNRFSLTKVNQWGIYAEKLFAQYIVVNSNSITI